MNKQLILVFLTFFAPLFSGVYKGEESEFYLKGDTDKIMQINDTIYNYLHSSRDGLTMELHIPMSQG